MVGRKYKINKKEKNFLLVGIISGMAGGVVGNLMISSFFSFSDSLNLEWYWYLVIFILSLGSFFGILFWLLNKMEKN